MHAYIPTYIIHTYIQRCSFIYDVCMYECMYKCTIHMHTRLTFKRICVLQLYIYMYICMYIHTYKEHTHKFKYTNAKLYFYEDQGVYMHSSHIHTQIHTCTYKCTHTKIHKHKRKGLLLGGSRRIYEFLLCVCVCVCVYTQIHTHKRKGLLLEGSSRIYAFLLCVCVCVCTHTNSYTQTQSLTFGRV